jgi:hypothetical protein
MTVDLLRRSEQFQEAKGLIDEKIDLISEKVIRDVKEPGFSQVV